MTIEEKIRNLFNKIRTKYFRLVTGAILGGILLVTSSNISYTQETKTKSIEKTQTSKNSESTGAFIHSGIEYVKKNLDDKAIEQFKKALELDPNNIKAHMLLGISQSRKLNLEKAVESWDNVLKINPDYMPAKEYIKNIERIQEVIGMKYFEKEVKSILEFSYTDPEISLSPSIEDFLPLDPRTRVIIYTYGNIINFGDNDITNLEVNFKPFTITNKPISIITPDKPLAGGKVKRVNLKLPLLINPLNIIQYDIVNIKIKDSSSYFKKIQQNLIIKPLKIPMEESPVKVVIIDNENARTMYDPCLIVRCSIKNTYLPPLKEKFKSLETEIKEIGFNEKFELAEPRTTTQFYYKYSFNKKVPKSLDYHVVGVNDKAKVELYQGIVDVK